MDTPSSAQGFPLDMEGGSASLGGTVQPECGARGNEFSSSHGRQGSRLQGAASNVLSVSDFHGAQAGRVSKAYFRPITAKQVLGGPKVQNDKPFRVKGSNCHSILANLCRYSRCLPARSNSSVTSQIFKLSGDGSTLLFQGHAFRLGPRSLRFYETGMFSVGDIKRKRSASYGILGRLDNLGGLGSSGSSRLSGSSQPLAVARVQDEPGEICVNSQSASEVVRCDVGRGERQVFVTRAVCRRGAGTDWPRIRSDGGYETNVGALNGQVSLRGADSPEGNEILSRSSSAAFARCKESGRVSKCSGHAEESAGPLVGWRLAKGVCSNSRDSARVDSVDRCLQHGLGSLLVTSSSGQGPVDSGREGIAHKRAGVACGLQSNLSAGFRAGFRSFCNRQCGNSGGYSQAGIKEWDDSENCAFVIREGLDTRNHSECVENSGQSECGSRRPVSGSSCSDGVGVAHGRIPAAGENAGPSAGRYVCDASESQGSMFCSAIRPSGSSGDGCFHSRLEPMGTDLSFSPAQAFASRRRSPEVVSSPRSDRGAKKGNGSLVSVPVISSVGDQVTGGPRASSSGGSRESAMCLLRRLDRVQFLKAVFGRYYARNVAMLLASAYRASSNRQAEVAWRAFKNWVPADVKSISKSMVLSFLTYLFEVRGLSPRTILGYRSSLALPLKLGFKVDVKASEFSLLAKAQFIMRPPRAKIIPQWSISAALKSLEEPRFTRVDIAPEDLFLKTLFLVALASGNRVSELAALDRAAIRWENDLMGVTIPVRQGFLFKNQSLDRVPPGVYFPSLGEPKALCPVASLKSYLVQTENQEHASRVFLHPSSFTPLNAGSISYWLYRAITTFVPGSIPRAHDVRKISFSLAWARGVPMGEIIKRGFWASANVFINKYLSHASAEVRCVAAASR